MEESIAELTRYYGDLWSKGSDAMSIPSGIVKTELEAKQLTAFFFWTSWAAGTNRPGEAHTYTANWPFDPLVGNRPLPSALVCVLIFGSYLMMRRAIEEPTQRARARLAYGVALVALRRLLTPPSRPGPHAHG